MIVVLSTGRSGTKSIAEYLGGSPDVHAVHEPQPLLVDEIVGTLTGRFPAADLVARLRETRSPRVDAREYAESNLGMSFAIGSLEQAFPGIRYVWLVRDGRDVVASFVRRRLFEDQDGPRARTDWLAQRFGLDWFGEMSREEWNRLPAFEKACHYWSRTNVAIREGLAGVSPERQVRVRLEHVATEAPPIWTRFGIAEPAGGFPMINQSRFRDDGGWEEWSPDQRAAFRRIGGWLMDEAYPGWHEGGWQPSWVPPLGTRVKLSVQQTLRSMVYAGNGASRSLNALLRRLPAPVKLRLKRLAGH